MHRLLVHTEFPRGGPDCDFELDVPYSMQLPVHALTNSQPHGVTNYDSKFIEELAFRRKGQRRGICGHLSKHLRSNNVAVHLATSLYS